MLIKYTLKYKLENRFTLIPEEENAVKRPKTVEGGDWEEGG